MSASAVSSAADLVSAFDAWALRALAANGFGDAAAPAPSTDRSIAMQMQVRESRETAARYAKCVEVSKRVRWDIDRDVLRGRTFDFSRKFLPDGLTMADRLPFLSDPERRLLSQVQGRTYAWLFGLVERFIGAKVLEVSAAHWFGDQTALESLVRFTDEELKHQELFRRVGTMIADGMPAGYTTSAEPNALASAVLARSTWAVLALTCHIELFTQVHYRASIDRDPSLSDLFKDVFLFHWKEESQHAILDELEWLRVDATLSAAERDEAVDDLIALVGAVDGLLRAQATADTRYFLDMLDRALPDADAKAVGETMLRAYRWQYIGSGVSGTRFPGILSGIATPAQVERVTSALAPILA